jgi:hypothetical protein
MLEEARLQAILAVQATATAALVQNSLARDTAVRLCHENTEKAILQNSKDALQLLRAAPVWEPEKLDEVRV